MDKYLTDIPIKKAETDEVSFRFYYTSNKIRIFFP